MDSQTETTQEEMMMEIVVDDDELTPPKQCIFSTDNPQPILLVGGILKGPVELSLCHLCNSIVKLCFDKTEANQAPRRIDIVEMRFMCTRAHKHKGTFSFNTATKELDDAGRQIDLEQSGKPIEDENSILKEYLLKYNSFLKKKDEALTGDVASLVWLEATMAENKDRDDSLVWMEGTMNKDGELDSIDGVASKHLKHFMQSVFTFLKPVTKLFFQSLIESLMAEFKHIA